MVSKAALDTLSAKLLFVVSGLVALSCAAPAWAFSLDDVVARAKALSDRPYAAPVSNLPPEFRGMQFADYQKIEPRHDKDQWAGLDTPFKLSFYHQGMQFNTPVKISEIVGDKVSEIRYDPARFDFGDLKFDSKTTSQLGYAGFRVMYPVNRPGKLDEVMSLLGASYFRVIGKGQVYGLSARGLAIDSGLAKPEEFPAFREFWVQRPQPQDDALVFYALLDSPRATGAYRFVLKMSGDAVLDVQARVFMRGTVDVLGIAPLTSMFLYGPNQRREANNFRPALHDSDGLAIHAGDGEWLWRPLNNPKNVALSYFQVTNPKGFGLLQRNHDFANYLDLADRYDLRPSAWIEPLNDWGKGNVELVEIPSPDETNDNIVAFWTPATLPPKGQPIVADYRIRWTLDEPALLDKEVGWVKDTLRADGEVRQANLIRALDGSTMLVADFTGPVLAALPADAKVEAQVGTNDNVEILENTLQPNPAIHGWRLSLRVKVKDPARAAELRGALVSNGKVLTETWSYQLPPNEVPLAGRSP